ncbi:TPA: TetR/AcrR family transcriptional regulator [Stenotrophomonas maltophilia]|uniref:TetR/AcrR family transcriptional regulator n=1 Tax=Stenotrophomonas maltophilia TaxID=40324 RepID=A0AAJ2MV76_STEMA|nr:TetR/AcrR family transcriptional regulator [Stenotrophomonas maltophilia]MDT3468327.1 TetR/AcrR family transcriptional regulator [Stenotrophomonas maltophilia]
MSTSLSETHSGRSGRWNRLRERRRLELLNGAAKVFAEHGYDHANIRILAEAANVTKATVYAHFHNKCDLFKAVVDHWVELCPEPELSSPQAKALQSLLLEAAHSIIRQAEHPASRAFGQVIQRSTQLPSNYVQAWHSQYGRHVEHLRRVFGHHTSVADPLMYASQFVQVILGCVHGGMASETTCRETYVASSVELFVNGVPQRSLAEVTTEVSDGAESASRLNAHARN